MEHLVQHAVTTIRERFWEPLSLDELARSAMVSKYYFLRVFTRVTGVTPGRFLCAVRLQEAKRLLLNTSLTVADISVQVGYSSTGSFTRRFTEWVGLSPTQYRKLSLAAPGERREQPALTEVAGPAPQARATGSVTGVLRTAGTVLSPVYVGVFDSTMLQGTPASWTNASASGRFTLARVPVGTWYIHAVAHGRHPECAAEAELTPLTATVGPVRVKGDAAHRLGITLTPPDWTRPPILSALMDLDPQPMAA
ncbi:helix-turn-helix domain-containing protein (plasmid) [Streptomyces sp. FXJ1.172]|jgi:AraC-like DNA-binding protein|uniref:helix-turn-helix domain-containing protein n=1 Tax=Streptomyces sp. FXJ1.172 TaxID=710705 RepID=UPI0023DCEC98|nr:helix-turn-helix domain-containing protein [Streptomyces sp. FXJ1.172]WEP00998.1 helix-turn-helix domain-containing protein [Streptomyces sp. FXJ1.172]